MRCIFSKYIVADALVKQSNQTLMVVVLDDQPNILQMPIAFAKALNTVIVNGHTGKVFLAAHGDGGIQYFDEK